MSAAVKRYESRPVVEDYRTTARLMPLFCAYFLLLSLALSRAPEYGPKKRPRLAHLHFFIVHWNDDGWKAYFALA